MTLFPSVTTWKPQLKIGQIDKKYVVQLKREFGCCKTYKVDVNNEEITNDLPMHFCSPFYKMKGEYCWEQDNNYFLLVRDSLLFALCSKKHRLFVNHFDVESGIEFGEFWKQRGWQHFFVGVCLLSLGIGMSIITRYLDSPGLVLAFATVLFVLGALIIVFGLFLIFYKHKTPGDIYMVQGIDNFVEDDESQTATSC